jgi:hypothetical protein
MAQRTKSPGETTWNSPSRNFTLASPRRPKNLSILFIIPQGLFFAASRGLPVNDIANRSDGVKAASRGCP